MISNQYSNVSRGGKNMLRTEGGGSFISDTFEGIGLTENLEPMCSGNSENCGFHDHDYDAEYYENKQV